jgi:hypothetical protein
MVWYQAEVHRKAGGMKVYLRSLAIWYTVLWLFMMFMPTRLTALVDLNAGSLVGINLRTLYLVLYGGSVILCIWSSTKYDAGLRLLAQGIALTSAISWFVFITVGAIAKGSGFSAILVWGWVILVQAGSIRYYDLPPSTEREATEHLQTLLRTEREKRSGYPEEK